MGTTLSELTHLDPEAALERVEALCKRWDEISKGETATTRAIREAIRG